MSTSNGQLAAGPPGAFSTFRVTKQNSTPRIRAKFGPERRIHVGAVRKRRACLRCRLLQIKVSESNPVLVLMLIFASVPTIISVQLAMG
jgi:hypothetical protein